MSVLTRDPASTGARPRATRPVRVAVFGLLLALAATVSVYGLSFPGYPADGVLVAFLAWCGVLVAACWLAASRRSIVGLLAPFVGVAVVVGLAVGVVDARPPLAWRFAGSQADFQRVVDAALRQDPGFGSDRDEVVGTFPGGCPTSIGSYTIVDCRAFAGGYLFLQAPDAITDDSGFVYLPDGIPRYQEEDGGWRDATGYTHLDGPWYAWTCHC